MMKLALSLAFCASLVPAVRAENPAPKIGDTAPHFALKTNEGQDFDLNSRKGHGWTVLYFYPKAETPGCTKEACAFRDAIKVIRERNAEVYGLSTDSVKDIAAFHAHHHLNFPLLADADGQVTRAYGAAMPVIHKAKRWTFILDPDLKIRRIETDVDPVKEADRVANELKSLQEQN